MEVGTFGIPNRPAQGPAFICEQVMQISKGDWMEPAWLQTSTQESRLFQPNCNYCIHVLWTMSPLWAGTTSDSLLHSQLAQSLAQIRCPSYQGQTLFRDCRLLPYRNVGPAAPDFESFKKWHKSSLWESFGF